MTSKIFSTFLIGFILYLLLDFLFFVAIKVNYIDIYHIKEYYNVLFVDHQSVILLTVGSFLLGSLIMQTKASKIFAFAYIFMIFFTVIMMYEPIGKYVGSYMFRKNNLSFKIGKIQFSGDLLYKGRVYSYIYRKDLDKIIKLKNSEFSENQ